MDCSLKQVSLLHAWQNLLSADIDIQHFLLTMQQHTLAPDVLLMLPNLKHKR